MCAMPDDFESDRETEGLICTECFRPTYIKPDVTGLDIKAVIDLCTHWRCAECLDRWEKENPSANLGC